MRRGERAIESKDGQKAILEHCRVCSLAFSGDEYPYVIPLNYGFVWNEDQETPVLYFHGAPVGTKIEHKERDNRAAFRVQHEKECILRRRQDRRRKPGLDTVDDEYIDVRCRCKCRSDKAA